MLNWISIKYSRIYFRICPPPLIEGQYWWVKNIYGDLMRVLIKAVDGNIVVVKNMTDFKFTTTSRTTETSCFIHDIRWVRKAISYE